MHQPVIVAARALPCTRPGHYGSEGYGEGEALARLIAQTVSDAQLSRHDIGTLSLTLSRSAWQQALPQYLAGYLGISGTGSFGEVQAGGLTGGLALDRAADDIRLGRSRVAVAAGVLFEGAPDPSSADRSLRTTGNANFQSNFGTTPLSWYALDGARFLHENRVTRESLAAVAIKNRRHAMDNPIAQYRTAITLDDVLAQPLIAEPFGRFEVSPRSDGAICILLADEELAKASTMPYARLSGRGFHQEAAHQFSSRPSNHLDYEPLRLAAIGACADANCAIGDMDAYEIYAPLTAAELIAITSLGIFPRGSVIQAVEDNETSIGGLHPVCTSGGCLSRGHPPPLTGLYNVLEAFEQLTDRAEMRQVRNARRVMTSCEIGRYNGALVHIFERAT